MSDLIKDNWFVILIAVIIIAFVGYFIVDSNKDNVSAKSSGGKDVLAVIADTDITADELYEDYKPFDGDLIYNMYRNAVVGQSVTTTKEMEEEAKKLENTIRSQVSSQSSEAYRDAITAELASYGFDSYDKLYDYCLMTVQQKALNKEYVDAHFDELKDKMKDSKARVVSLIKMEAADPKNLTEEETKKRDNIDKAIESGTFADAATAFSEDADTAAKDGVFGYIDASSTASTTSLGADLLSAALALNEGETSDWIEVQNESTGVISLYKVHVDTTDLDTIHKSKDSDVQDSFLYAIMNDVPGLEVTVLEDAVKKLDVTFEDKAVQTKLENYMAAQKGETENE